MTRKRNEGGRFSKDNDWYKQIEEDHIRRIEAERAKQEEAAYLAGQPNLTEAEWQATLKADEYGEESDGTLVNWDVAA
jgi:hypothetical protein